MGLFDKWIDKKVESQLQQQLKAMQQFTGYQYVNGRLTYVAADKIGNVKDGFEAVSTLYSIITICTRKFSSIPFYLYKVEDKKAFEGYLRLKNSGEIFSHPKALAEARKLRKKGLQEVESGDAVAFLKKPGSSTEAIFRQQLLGFLMITGDTFFRINQGQQPGEDINPKIKPAALEILSSPHMDLIINDAIEIAGYKYQITPDKTLSRTEVVQWRYPNYNWDAQGSHLKGLSPIKAGNKDVTAASHAMTAQAKMYEHGGADGLVVRNEDLPMTTEQRDMLQGRFDKELNTSEKKGYKFLTNANVRWEQMGMSAVDMNLIEGKKSIKEDLCNIYNFPINLLNNDRTTDNNYKHALKYLVTNTIANELDGYSDVMTEVIKTFWGEGYHYGYDVTELPELQDDIKEMAESLEKMWYITPNEKRVAMKYDELPGEEMNKIYIPSGNVPIDEASVGTMDPKANTDDYEN